MDVNDDAGHLKAHGALETIASRLAPTGICIAQSALASRITVTR